MNLRTMGFPLREIRTDLCFLSKRAVLWAMQTRNDCPVLYETRVVSCTSTRCVQRAQIGDDLAKLR